MKKLLFKIRKRLFFGYLLFALSLLDINTYCKNKDEANSVEHKNSQLNLYLDLIRYNCQEKIGILPYILGNSKGVYLEIGTGGDPIAKMLEEIPAKDDVTIIASDIDQDILNSLPVRHPKLQKYIDAKKGPKLQLQKINAINMGIIENGSLDGINASSVVHEIFSYEEGEKGLNNFFKEVSRTLKAGGVLVYRDPEGIKNKEKTVEVKLKSKSIRLFFHIFIYKFLDRKGSFLGRTGRKVQLYKPEEIIFHVYKKNETVPMNLTYDQYLATPSYDIDFYRDYKVTLPLGLYRELARHYLTYLHQCNPLVFVKCVPDVNSGLYVVNYFAHSALDKISNFLSQYKWEVIDGKINSEQKNKIEKKIYKNTRVLEFGVPLQFSSKIKETQLRSLLKKHDFAPGNHIISLDDGNCLLDYRLFGIFYDDITKQIFDDFNGLVDKKDEVHAKWLKREAEEFYFYLSDDELISKVAQSTITEKKVKNEEKTIFVLCPLSEKHNKFVHRICYTDILESSINVQDTLGYPIEVKDGKRVIHFCKMPLKEALSIYKKIIASDPEKYFELQRTVNNLKTKYKN